MARLRKMPCCTPPATSRTCCASSAGASAFEWRSRVSAADIERALAAVATVNRAILCAGGMCGPRALDRTRGVAPSGAGEGGDRAGYLTATGPATLAPPLYAPPGSFSRLNIER